MTDTTDNKAQVPPQGTRASMGDIPPKGKPPTVRAAKDVKAKAKTPKTAGTESTGKAGASAAKPQAPAKPKAKATAKQTANGSNPAPATKKPAAKSAPKKTGTGTAVNAAAPRTAPNDTRAPGLPACAQTAVEEAQQARRTSVPERAQTTDTTEAPAVTGKTDAAGIAEASSAEDASVTVYSIEEPDDIPESAFEEAAGDAVRTEAAAALNDVPAATAAKGPAPSAVPVPEQASKVADKNVPAKPSKGSKKASKTKAAGTPFSDLIDSAPLGLPEADLVQTEDVAAPGPAEDAVADTDAETPPFTPDHAKKVKTVSDDAAFVPDLNDAPDSDPDQARIYRGYELAPENTTTLKPEPLRKLRTVEEPVPEITVIELADDEAVIAQAGCDSVEALNRLTRQAQSAQAVITDRLQEEARQAWERRNDEARQAREAGPQKALREEALRALDEHNDRMATAPVPVPSAELVNGAGLVPDAAHLEAAAAYARQVAAFEDEALRRGHVRETGTVDPAMAKPARPEGRDTLPGTRMPIPGEAGVDGLATQYHPAPETTHSIITRLLDDWQTLTVSLRLSLTTVFVAAVGAVAAVTTTAFVTPAPLFVHADLDRVRQTMLLATLMDKAGLPSGRLPVLLPNAGDAMTPLPALNDTLLREALTAVAQQTGSTVLGAKALLAMPDENRAIPDVTDSILTVLGLQSFDTDRAQRALNQLLSDNDKQKLPASAEAVK